MCHNECVHSTAYEIKVCRLNSSSAKSIWKLRPQPPLGTQLLQLRFTFSSGGENKQFVVSKSNSGHVMTDLMNKNYVVSAELVWRENLYFETDKLEVRTLQTGAYCVYISGMKFRYCS